MKVGNKYRRATQWLKPHDPTVISFDALPVRDRQTDRHIAYSG